MAGRPAQEPQGVWASRPGGILRIPCHTKRRTCLDAECTAAGRRHVSQADWFVSSCSHSACHTFRNFRNLGESFSDGLSFGVSIYRGLPTWGLESGRYGSQQFLRVTRLPLASHLYLWFSPAVTFSSRCGCHCASLPGSCLTCPPSCTCRVFLLSL